VQSALASAAAKLAPSRSRPITRSRAMRSRSRKTRRKTAPEARCARTGYAGRTSTWRRRSETSHDEQGAIDH
jgi:hypothetical protein